MPSKLRPTALTVADAVKVLRAAGSEHLTQDALRADIEAGAPTNPDSTLNLAHYAAWLLKEMSRGSR